MHDVLFVRGRKAVRDLNAIFRRLARRQRRVVEPVAQRLAQKQLGDDVRRSLVRTDVVDRENVRMIQRARRTRFLLEAPESFGIRRKPADNTLTATSRFSRESWAR